jgi:tetratricopeptide (TPR) repeat protein
MLSAVAVLTGRMLQLKGSSMRRFILTLMFASLALGAGVALASFGGGSSQPDPKPSSPPSDQEASQERTPRQEAEETYALAYEEVAKAKQDLANNKAKNAMKKFRRALERGERATSLDPKYHEAWNLVGYSARKLGDYPKAFGAYERCLAIKSDYAPAREYLGEAYLDRDDPAKAREQLVLLEKQGAADEAKNLKGQIEAYEAKHGGTAAPPAENAPAASDSTQAIGSGR